MNILVLVLIVILLAGGGLGYHGGYFASGLGLYGGGGLGLVLFAVLLVVLLRGI